MYVNDGKEYQWVLSQEDADPGWDQFVLQSSGGHYTQTIPWGQAKKIQGWTPLRVKCLKESAVVAGVQILARRFPILGWTGYISKGPLLNEDCEKAQPLIKNMLKKCREAGFFYLAVQPPDNGCQASACFQETGFKPCIFGDIEKPATILIDLKPDLDQILNGIKPHRRRKIRTAQKCDIVYREGGEQDLSVFMRLFQENGRRNHFEPECESFIHALWKAFYPAGHIHILLAEIEGEAVSAHLDLVYKNRYYVYRAGWSGKYQNLYPNDGLFWYGIQQAKECGCDTYDLCGVDPAVCEAIQKGLSPLSVVRGTYSEYKLHYSDHVVLYPRTYDKFLIPGLSLVCSLFRSQKTLRQILKKYYRVLHHR